MDSSTRTSKIEEHREAIRNLEAEEAETQSVWPPPGYYLLWHVVIGMVLGGIGAMVSLAANAVGAPLFGERSLQLIREAGCKSGLVFNPHLGLDALKYVLDKVDMVLLMSVNPGFGGQKFIPGTLDKLREARAMIDASGYSIRLEVDGGVSASNIAEIAAAGADTFVAGSAIFNQPDYKAVIDAMRAELATV